MCYDRSQVPREMPKEMQRSCQLGLNEDQEPKDGFFMEGSCPGVELGLRLLSRKRCGP